MPCVAALLRSPPLLLLDDLPLLLLPAAALPILRRCSLICFYRNANLSGSACRGEHNFTTFYRWRKQTRRAQQCRHGRHLQGR